MATTSLIDHHPFWAGVWRILQEECGAGPDRFGFVSRAGAFPREWRFQGALGFGGKLWHQHGRPSVTCYREHETPERLAMIARANARLATLAAEQHTEQSSPIARSTSHAAPHC